MGWLPTPGPRCPRMRHLTELVTGSSRTAQSSGCASWGRPSIRHMSEQVGILGRLYPEARAGGYTHVDGTIEFYTRVNALLDPSAVVVDLGAGRGNFLEDQVAYRRELRRVRCNVARVIGL